MPQCVALGTETHLRLASQVVSRCFYLQVRDCMVTDVCLNGIALFQLSLVLSPFTADFTVGLVLILCYFIITIIMMKGALEVSTVVKG